MKVEDSKYIFSLEYGLMKIDKNEISRISEDRILILNSLISFEETFITDVYECYHSGQTWDVPSRFLLSDSAIKINKYLSDLSKE